MGRHKKICGFCITDLHDDNYYFYKEPLASIERHEISIKDSDYSLDGIEMTIKASTYLNMDMSIEKNNILRISGHCSNEKGWGGHSDLTKEIEIKYCPMCGRKLTNGNQINNNR